MMFLKGIGTSLGHQKLPFVYVETIKLKFLHENTAVNWMRGKEQKKGERYEYLGLEEAISHEEKLIRENREGGSIENTKDLELWVTRM